MNYCEKCKIIAEADSCPECGGTLREVAADDFCLLTECNQMFGDMLKGLFDDEGVVCALLPWGNGVRSSFGLRLENYKVYVPFRQYEQAKQLLAYFDEPKTDDLKENLLANTDKWHIVSPSTAKKILKKLKAPKDADVFEVLKQHVENAESIADRGLLTSFKQPAHGLAVKTDGIVLWFSADDYEILI